MSVRACVRACVRAGVRACMRVCAQVYLCVAVCVYVVIDHTSNKHFPSYLHYFPRLAGSSRTPPYTIRLDLRDGRPELPPVQRRRRRDLTAPTLREEFLTSHAIRVGFYGKPLVGNNHIVPEISVYTR